MLRNISSLAVCGLLLTGCLAGNGYDGYGGYGGYHPGYGIGDGSYGAGRYGSPGPGIKRYGTKRNLGTLGGAAAGGLAGAQVGNGTGQLAAVAAGTLLGAFVGNEIGSSLDKADQMYAQQAQQQALGAPMGAQVPWRNPQTGHYGTVVPVRQGMSESGEYCREYQHTIYVGGRSQKAFGQACQQQDGSWRIAG